MATGMIRFALKAYRNKKSNDTLEEILDIIPSLSVKVNVTKDPTQSTGFKMDVLQGDNPTMPFNAYVTTRKILAQYGNVDDAKLKAYSGVLIQRGKEIYQRLGGKSAFIFDFDTNSGVLLDAVGLHPVKMDHPIVYMARNLFPVQAQDQQHS